jgi:adenine-specific DNA-methyltransferase
MKYMGSKRWMLGNGLGDLLSRKAPRSSRFVDLFSGSSSVTVFVARRHKIPVLSVDLQNYGRVLSAAIIQRTKPLPSEAVWNAWVARARKSVARQPKIPEVSSITWKSVRSARAWSQGRRRQTITRAYGGHYFSPKQSIWLDTLRATSPKNGAYRNIAIATLIDVAAYCAAAPGHTAQPFQPTRSARKFVSEAWKRDVVSSAQKVFSSLCGLHAKVKGRAVAADALQVARSLRAGDLVFIDPPYSAVHYSRFYHVLETVATGRCGQVTGTGRYPSAHLRPKSAFSVASTAEATIEKLFKLVANKRARAIVTFPSHECSNGLSGRSVRNAAKKYFTVTENKVSSRFSTLGGNASVGDDKGRAARISASELILILQPKRRRAKMRT